MIICKNDDGISTSRYNVRREDKSSLVATNSKNERVATYLTVISYLQLSENVRWSFKWVIMENTIIGLCVAGFVLLVSRSVKRLCKNI